MKRDQLKELGLSDDQIKAVMDINGEDINKAKSNNDETIKENEALKSQLSERDKDFAKLKKTAKDNEELSQQLQELQGKYKQDHDNLTQELAKVKLNGAIDSALTSSKVRNTKAFKALLDMDTIKLDESGKLSGLDSQIESIRKSDPYLFDAGQKPNYNPSSGKPADSNETQTMIDVFKGESN